MGRKSPKQFRDCVCTFLCEVAGPHQTIMCSLTPPVVESHISEKDKAAAHQFVDSYNRHVAIFPDPHQPSITESEFEKCLDWLVSYPTRVSFDAVDFALGRDYTFSGWQTASPQSAGLNSELAEYYGSMQTLVTVWKFESVEQYLAIKAAANRIFGLKLNDKHLRPKSVIPLVQQSSASEAGADSES